MKYQITFTVRGLLTTFKDTVEHHEHDLAAFRRLLNEAIVAEDIKVHGEFPRVGDILLVIPHPK